MVALASSYFGSGDGVAPAMDGAPLLPAPNNVLIDRRKGAQAHLCVGLPALRRDDPETWVLEILHTVLGDGTSSRLFLHLREEAGLAYDVHSFVTDFHDCGLLGVYAGVDPAALGRALEAVLAELADLRDRPVPADELARARAFAGGRLELRLEDGRNLASWLGVQEALHEQTMTIEQALSKIEAVDAEAVQRLAGRLFRDEALALAVISPPGYTPAFRRSVAAAVSDPFEILMGARPAAIDPAPLPEPVEPEPVEPDSLSSRSRGTARRPAVATRRRGSPGSTWGPGSTRWRVPSWRHSRGEARSMGRPWWTSPRCGGEPATWSAPGTRRGPAWRPG